MQKIMLIVYAPLRNTSKRKKHVTWKEKSMRRKEDAIFNREIITRAIGKVKILLLLKEECNHQLKSLDNRGINQLNSNYIFSFEYSIEFHKLLCDLYTQPITSLA